MLVIHLSLMTSIMSYLEGAAAAPLEPWVGAAGHWIAHSQHS